MQEQILFEVWMQFSSNLFAIIVKLKFKNCYCWVHRNKMISQKIFNFQARLCERQLDLLLLLKHVPSQYFPGQSLALKEPVRPAQEMEPILLLIVLQGLQRTFYRETEKTQYFWLNTELWCPWAHGQIMWTLCSSPLPTHNPGRGIIKRCTGGVIIPHVLFY